ncbi:MAG: bactofilin family protein [Myxococcota bacterium]
MAQASSYIDPSQRIEGLVSASEDLVLAGHLVGELQSSHALIVDSSGIAEANITARRVEIHGVVVGDVVASDDVVVSRTGQVQGSIKARRVQVESGGRLDADVTSGEGAQPARSARRTPARRTSTRPAVPRRTSGRDTRLLTRERTPAPIVEVTSEPAPAPTPEPAKKRAKKPTKGRSKRSTVTKSTRGKRTLSDEIVEIPEQDTVEDTA